MGERPMETQPTPARTIYDRETVAQHIQRNLLNASPETLSGRRCGDGRDKSNYMEAIFGSDLGYVFAAESALRKLDKIKPGKEQDAIRSILSAVAGEGNVYVHTDNHGDNQNTLIGGCGANGVARRNLGEFGLTQTDIDAMDQVLEELDAQQKVTKDVYEGDHIEGAVLAVHGRDFGVRAMDEKTNTSVFVMQVGLINDRFIQIAQQLKKAYQVSDDVLLKEMMKSWKTHTDIIAKELAKLPDGRPLPVFQVNFQTNGIPVLTQ